MTKRLLAALVMIPLLQQPLRQWTRLAGQWSGNAEIFVNWTRARTLHLDIRIDSAGDVTGKVGDATLVDGRITTNRGAIGRSLHIKTDYIVDAKLDGALIAAEGVRRTSVKIPLDWNGRILSGSVHSNGSKFGGADRMILTAGHLKLVRADSATRR